MSYEYTILNAFSASPDGGNPAAVIFLPPPPSFADASAVPDDIDITTLYPPTSELQRIATELAQPMTAFLVPLRDTAHESSPAENATHTYAVRWFNPSAECWICGHATMALSSLLASSGTKSLQLRTVRYGVVASEQVINPWGEDYLTAIDFPEMREHVALDIKEGRGKEVWEVIVAATEGSSWGVEDVLGIREDKMQIILELRPEVDLAGVKVDCEKLAPLDPAYIIPFQIVPRSERKHGPHLRSRVWGAQKGFRVEDSATGSAHCGILPYVLTNDPTSDRLLENHNAATFGLDPQLRQIFRIQQVSPRGGEVLACWKRDEGRVRLMGTCVEVRRGEVR